MKKIFVLFVLLVLISPAFSQDTEKEMKNNWELVVSAYKVSPVASDTLEKMDNFVDRYKDSNKNEAAGILYLKGNALHKNKKYTQAYETFKRLVNDFSSTPYADGAMYKMGECLYNMGKYNDAIELWNNFRFKYSTSLFIMESVYGIALSYLNLKEYMKADKVLSEFLERYNYYAKEDKIKIIGGIIDYYLQRYESAAEKLKRLNYDVAYYYLGHSLVKAGKYLEGASAFKKIDEEFKNSIYLESALYNKAEAFYKGENYQVAASDYKAFLTKFPNSNLSGYAAFKMGSAYFKDKKYDAAINAYRDVAARVSDARLKAYAQYLIGESYRKLKDFNKAQIAYEKIIEGYKEIYDVYSSALLKAGWCYIVLNNFNKAESVLSEFTQKFITHENLALGYYLMGNANFLKNQYAVATQSYKFILDKFKYSDLTEAALLMTMLCYYKQDQMALLVSEGSHMLEILSSKFQSPKSKIRARTYYYLGMAYFKTGMYGPAAQAFNEIIEKYYDSDITNEARANLAWCYYELENYKAARTMARDVISSNIKEEVKMACELLVAHSFFCEKQYDKATASYGEFAYKYAKSKNFELVAEALFQQGKVYEIQEYYMDAVKSWQALYDNYPKSKRAPEALYKISDIYFKAQQYDKAIAGFQRILEKYPNADIAEDAMLAIAEVYYNSDQEAKAVQAYKDFIKKYPNSSKVKSVEDGMQRAEYRKAEKKEDPELLLQFYEKYPQSNLAVDALYKAAELYYQTGKFDKAVNTFNKLIEEFPNDTLAINAHYYIGACYEELKKTEDAINAYKAFIKNYPKHELTSDVYFRLATAAYMNKNFTDAAFYYERILEKYPGTEYEKNAMYNLALTYTDLNKMDDAIRYYKLFYKKYPDDEKSKTIPSQIAGIYLEQKRYTEAIASYQEIADKGSDTEKMEAYYRIGDIYMNTENHDKALETFSNLIDMKPKDNVFRVTGLINLATIYEEKSDWKNAVKIYNLIVDSGGQKDYVDGAKARISEIKNAYPDLFKEETTKEKKTEKK